MVAPAFTIDEYLAIVSGAGDETPPRARVNTPYKTNYQEDTGEFFAFFKAYLVKDIEYTIFFESSVTLEDFVVDHTPLYYWTPTAWAAAGSVFDSGDPQQSYLDETDEDVAPYSDPYDYKLNEETPRSFYGGRRYKFTPTETGYHIFGSFFETPE